MNVAASDQPFVFSTSMPVAATLASEGGTPLPHRESVTAEDLIQRAKREINEIIREVARLAKQPLARDSFFASLVDRTVIAIGAEGAIIWDCQHPMPVPVVRTGRTTDASIALTARDAHARLLHEVCRSGDPVVVPGTPDSCDPHLPSNPTRFPAAVVPILDPLAADQEAHLANSTTAYVFEVFLEPEAGVATQRSYLRFVTQMADLAAQFLHADELRAARHKQALTASAAASLRALHQYETAAALSAAIVDQCANLFHADRVLIAAKHRDRARLLAASHVTSIDFHSSAVQQLEQTIAKYTFEPDQVCWTDQARDEACMREQADASIGHALYPLAVVRDQRDSLRLVVQGSEPESLGALELEVLEEYAVQALAMLRAKLQFESIPLARAYLALTPALYQVSPTRIRRYLTGLALLAAMALLAWLPTPMMVTVPATLRRQDAHTHYAPSDAIIESWAVQHGQIVAQGDLLLRLRDWSLEEQMTTLLSRRAVLSQRLSRSIANLVDSPDGSLRTEYRATTSDEDLVQQQRLLEEEISGIDQQLELVEQAKQRLEIRADRDGVVDAWKDDSTDQGRPVRRGDALIRVHPRHSPWLAVAAVPQSRIGVVLDQLQASTALDAHLNTIARPTDKYDLTFHRREPLGVQNAAPGSVSVQEVALGLEFMVASPSQPNSSNESSQGWQHGSPAEVTIDCGTMPLAKVVFFDLQRSLQRRWAQWF